MATACQQKDHQYERGAYGVCKRCGGDRPNGMSYDQLAWNAFQGLTAKSAAVLNWVASNPGSHKIMPGMKPRGFHNVLNRLRAQGLVAPYDFDITALLGARVVKLLDKHVWGGVLTVEPPHHSHKFRSDEFVTSFAA